MGLEMSIPDMELRMKYYDPGELEFKYAKKFLASMKESLESSRKELAELEKADAGKGGTEGSGG